MTYVGPEETDEYGTCDDFAMLCSDGSVYLFSMAYYTNAYGRKTYGLYSRSLLGNVPGRDGELRRRFCAVLCG